MADLHLPIEKHKSGVRIQNLAPLEQTLYHTYSSSKYILQGGKGLNRLQ
jgi:hypothetical protein